MRLSTRAYASASVISFGEMRSYACYPSSELVGEGIRVLSGCTRDLSYGLALVAVHARCLSAIVGVRGCCGSGLSQQWVQQIHHSWLATSVDQRACQLPVLLRLIFLRGFVGRRIEEASHVCRLAMGLARAFDLCGG